MIYLSKQKQQAAGQDVIKLSQAQCLAAGDFELDREKGLMKGVSFLTRGPTIGHGFDVDDVMLTQVAEGINRNGGVQVHYKHAKSGLFGDQQGEGIESIVGLALNARVDDDRVRGDLQLEPCAKSNPGGDYWSYIFDLVESETLRSKIGLSIAFVPALFEERTDPATNQSLPPAGRVKDVFAVDFTDHPGANPSGLLSRGATPGLAGGGWTMNEALRKYLLSVGLKAEATEEEATAFLAGLEGDQKIIADNLGAQTIKDADLDIPPAAVTPPAGDATPPPADNTDLAKKVVVQTLEAERTRVQELSGLAKQCGLDAAWIEKHSHEGTTIEAATKLALAKVAAERKPLHIAVGSDLNSETLGAAIGDAILLRSGVSLVEFDPVTELAVRTDKNEVKVREPHARAREFRSMRWIEMGRAWLNGIGIPEAYTMKRVDVAELMMRKNALRDRFGSIALAQSTSDFPYILENVLGKSLRAQYEETPRSWLPWVRRTTAPDFKDVKRVALSEAADLESRPEGGPIKYAALSETRETYALVEYAKGVMLTRRAIINDDLEAFRRIPQLQATAAARLEDTVVYAILTANAVLNDAVALFDTSTHANLAGSGAAPSVTTLDAARAAMRVQTGPGGAILSLVPAFIIMPAALEGTVKTLLNSDVDPAATAANTANIWKGGLFPVIEPRLDATVDGNTDAATWYLAANYNQVDTIEICFLEDEQVPVLKQETVFDTDDVKYAVRHTVVAKAIDYRGLYKNPGN